MVKRWKTWEASCHHLPSARGGFSKNKKRNKRKAVRSAEISWPFAKGLSLVNRALAMTYEPRGTTRLRSNFAKNAWEFSLSLSAIRLFFSPPSGRIKNFFTTPLPLFLLRVLTTYSTSNLRVCLPRREWVSLVKLFRLRSPKSRFRNHRLQATNAALKVEAFNAPIYSPWAYN